MKSTAWACGSLVVLALAITAPARAQIDGGVPSEDAGAPIDAAIVPEVAEQEPAEGEIVEEEAADEVEGEEEVEAEEAETDAEENEDEEREAPRGPIRYTLERITIRGNTRTDTGLIRSYVPLRVGDTLDVEDPRIETVEWRLLGTGWFDRVNLSLERGSARGQVVLVIEVHEQNTFIVQGLALGFSEGVLNSDDPDTSLEPYFGISLAELNLFGTGMTLEASALLSVPQQGVRLRAGARDVLGSDFGLTGSLFFNNAREFFGNDDVIISLDECPTGSPMACEVGRNAVVVYRRYGGSIGTGVDIAPTVRFTLDYRLEAVEVVDRPEAASHRRGTEIVPIDFAVHDGLSWISSLHLGVVHDERDEPALPTQGRILFAEVDIATSVIGSEYDFVRIEAGWREWIRLPDWRHTLRLGLFVGAAVGDAPFFYKFYVGDMSDLIPSRLLDLNLDRRAPPNLLDTSIREMRAEELAGRLDVEYGIWVYEGNDGFRGLQIYGLIGVYVLMDRDDLAIAIPGYQGFARVPIDLTFDIGLRFDTVVGVFEVGFSTLLGFISI
jgi:outer membrane protein insertion porin family